MPPKTSLKNFLATPSTDHDVFIAMAATAAERATEALSTLARLAVHTDVSGHIAAITQQLDDIQSPGKV